MNETLENLSAVLAILYVCRQFLNTHIAEKLIKWTLFGKYLLYLDCYSI